MMKVRSCNSTMHHRYGFTLVEVLISMVIFSLLMVLVSGAMEVATKQWQKENGTLNEKLSEYILFEKLSRSIAGMQPYSVSVRPNQQISVFFQGKPNRVTFVVSKGMYNSGPVILSLRIIEVGEFYKSVQVAEEPLSKTMLTLYSDLDDIEWRWRNISTELVDASFSFYGYESLNELMLDRTITQKSNAKMRWFTEFDGQNRQILPSKIAISWQKFEQGQTVDSTMQFSIMVNDKTRYKIIENQRYAN